MTKAYKVQWITYVPYTFISEVEKKAHEKLFLELEDAESFTDLCTLVLQEMESVEELLPKIVQVELS